MSNFTTFMMSGAQDKQFEIKYNQLVRVVSQYLGTSDLAKVPYTGAVSNVNLGSFTITAGNLSGTNTGDQDLSGYSLTTHNHGLNNLTEKSYNSLTDKPSLFSGSYTDLSNKPTIPTALSNLTKDINFDERYYTETEIDTKIGDIETLLAAL